MNSDCVFLLLSVFELNQTIMIMPWYVTDYEVYEVHFYQQANDESAKKVLQSEAKGTQQRKK